MIGQTNRQTNKDYNFIYKGIYTVSSRYHPNIIQISFKYHPDITPISYRYHPNIIQISSKYYPDIIQILSRYHPDIIQISSKYHTDIIQISSRYNPNIIQKTSSEHRFLQPPNLVKSRVLTQIWHDYCRWKLHFETRLKLHLILEGKSRVLLQFNSSFCLLGFEHSFLWYLGIYTVRHVLQFTQFRS